MAVARWTPLARRWAGHASAPASPSPSQRPTRAEARAQMREERRARNQAAKLAKRTPSLEVVAPPGKAPLRLITLPRATLSSLDPGTEHQLCAVLYNATLMQNRRKLARRPEGGRLAPTTTVEHLRPISDEEARARQEWRIRRRATVVVHAAHESDRARARDLAAQLGLDMRETLRECRAEFDFVLHVTPKQLALSPVPKPPLMQRALPVAADFVQTFLRLERHASFGYRREPLLRAVRVPGLTPGETHVVDGTAGLGVDAFTLAYHGFHVTMLERDAIVYALLYDAYQRGLQHAAIARVLSRVSVHHAEHGAYLASLSDAERPDVVFLDPMYPTSDYVRSLPRKPMMIARRLLELPEPVEGMIDVALRYARERVVLKRPPYEPESPGVKAVYAGKTVRFEMFSAHQHRAKRDIDDSALTED